MLGTRNQGNPKPKLVGLGDWKLKVLMLESVVFAGLVMAGVAHLLSSVFHLPQPVSMAIGFFALGWATFPMLSIYGRSKNHQLGFRTELVMSTTAALPGGFLFWLAVTYWH